MSNSDFNIIDKIKKIDKNLEKIYLYLQTWSKKRNYSLTISIIALVISSSGWTAFIYTTNTNQPNLRAKVFQVIQGKMQDPYQPGNMLSTFTFYICVVNEGYYPAEVLNYQIQVNQEDKYENLTRIYNVQNKNFTFLSDEYIININNLSQKLIYLKQGPVTYGEAKHGFILFASNNSKLDINKIKEYKIIITDVYNNEYSTITKPSEFMNLYRLNEFADIEIIEKEYN